MLESDHSPKRLSLSALGRRLRSVPAMLLLLPFVVGVALHDSFSLSSWAVVALFSLLLGVGLWCRVWYLRLAAVVAMTTTAGYYIAELRTNRCAVPLDRELEVVVRVDQVPERRSSRVVSQGVIEAWREDGVWHDERCDVMLRLPDDELREGDRVQMHSVIRSRISNFESYDRLLHRRGFVGRVDVTSGEYRVLKRGGRASLHAQAVRRLERHLSDSAAYATAEAMVVGSKRLITQSIKRDYADTGLSHLMAISGLHLGIIMLVVGLLLRPLVLIYGGYQLRAIVVIILLWVFAAVSGFTPSVVRSALMLSALQLSYASMLRYNSLNTLSVVVFVMLIYRPSYLFDLSFQLSVMAVLGIVVWGVPLLSLLSSQGVRTGGVLSGFVMAVVATLWAMPIMSYTFGSVSFINILLSPLVFITAYVVVGFGVFALVLPASLAGPFAWVMELAARLQNGIVECGAQSGVGVVECSATKWQVAAVYMLFALITFVVWSWEAKKMVTLSLDE